MKQKQLKIEEGKAYKLKHPNGMGEKDKLYIEYILDNPVKNILETKLIVCRMWSKNKKRWYRYIYEYWQISMFNEWKVDYKKIYTESPIIDNNEEDNSKTELAKNFVIFDITPNNRSL